MKSFDKSPLLVLRLIWAYKDLLRNHFKPVSQLYIRRFRQSQIKAAQALRGKDVLDVAFMLTIPGMWKVDEVFKAMQKNPHYHPYMVLYPYSVYKGFDDDEILKTLERTRKYVEDKGYEYVIPYDEKKRKWIDLRKVAKPDIVFFSTPYKDSLPKYFVSSFRDTLTCYVAYAFNSLNMYRVNYDLLFHNIIGICFLETRLHQEFAAKYARNKGVNTVVTGYPATEVFLRNDYVPRNLWKQQDQTKKRVIYAPHHSIDNDDYPSVFLETCDDMLKLAEKYSGSIQFVFKPHQLLKFKLQQIWGNERTEDYYRRWDSLENARLVSDGYEDLFLTSDALIHDCGSFTTEYLFVKKPVMYLCRDTDMSDKFNEFGQRSFNCHYQGRTIEDVERFLSDVVVGGNDPMKEQREQFFDDYLKPEDGTLPSQKILQVIEDVIRGKEGWT